MEITPLRISGACLIRPILRKDERGSFVETFRASELERLCPYNFVQENLALSYRRGTVRGLHFQAPPKAQDKLVRVARGAIIDVIVDLRTKSPTYGEALAIELSGSDPAQLFVPRGLAHGYCTTADETEVVYKVTNYYDPKLEGGIAWDDPELLIEWPVAVCDAIVSQRDGQLPRLRGFHSPFV